MDKAQEVESKYAVNIEDGVLVLVDLDCGGVSLTNDMLKVMSEIETKIGTSLLRRPIVYQDSEGSWDVVDYRGNHVSMRYGGGNLSVAKAIAKRGSEYKLVSGSAKKQRNMELGMAKDVDTFNDFKGTPGGRLIKGVFGEAWEQCDSWATLRAIVCDDWDRVYFKKLVRLSGAVSSGERSIILAVLVACDFARQADEMAEGGVYQSISQMSGEHRRAYFLALEYEHRY